LGGGLRFVVDLSILLDIFVGMAQMYPGTPFRADISGADAGTEFRTTKMSSSMGFEGMI
jgi:hypothetical protein